MPEPGSTASSAAASQADGLGSLAGARAVRAAARRRSTPPTVVSSSDARVARTRSRRSRSCARRAADTCAVYVDHGLRAGVHDADVVAAAAARFGAEFRAVRSRDRSRRQSGGPARDARYAALAAVRLEQQSDAILVGHTRDDQAETVLLNLLRGSATSGLSGMPARRGDLRRPLLGFRRSETREICARLRLAPVQDLMNDDVRYRRVWLRREVIPQLERDACRDLVEVLARQADLVRDDSELPRRVGRGVAGAGRRAGRRPPGRGAGGAGAPGGARLARLAAGRGRAGRSGARGRSRRTARGPAARRPPGRAGCGRVAHGRGPTARPRGHGAGAPRARAVRTLRPRRVVRARAAGPLAGRPRRGRARRRSGGRRASRSCRRRPVRASGRSAGAARSWSPTRSGKRVSRPPNERRGRWSSARQAPCAGSSVTVSTRA